MNEKKTWKMLATLLFMIVVKMSIFEIFYINHSKWEFIIGLFIIEFLTILILTFVTWAIISDHQG